MREFSGLEVVLRKLESLVKEKLDSNGLMYRIFSRVKSRQSIEEKLEVKKYRENGRKITDLLGIRITLYFSDDVQLVYDMLKESHYFDHESRDSSSVDEFKPSRCNLTFRMEEPIIKEVISCLGNGMDMIDTTYEIQIRTVLSEGWHEIEHDLRYKGQDHWNGHEDLSRNLNGIFATLETSDFAMLKVIEALAYRHYKDKDVEALLKLKFRIRLRNQAMDENLKKLLEEDDNLRKKIFRINRSKFLHGLQKSRIRIPLTLDNLVFLVNLFELKDKRIEALENNIIQTEFETIRNASVKPKKRDEISTFF